MAGACEIKDVLFYAEIMLRFREVLCILLQHFIVCHFDLVMPSRNLSSILVSSVKHFYDGHFISYFLN